MLTFAGNSWAQTAPALAAGQRVARAPTVPPPPQSIDETTPERVWYGWQTLLNDAAATGLFIGALELGHGDLYDTGGSLGANALATLGIAGYVGGAPVIHLVHGRPGYAGGSALLRIGLPLIGGVVGNGAATCPPPEGDYGNCGLPELLVGFVGGLVAASVIDSALFAWERPKAEPPVGPQLSLLPVLSSDGKRGELRLFGTF